MLFQLLRAIPCIPPFPPFPYTARMFDPVDPKQSFPALERAILQYWREEAIFARSIGNREGRERFSFYDGPPFATGLPHYGHLLAGTIKDVIPRYQTMRGRMVERRFGWDCHGLPVENLVEKENDLKGKQDIEAMGVDRFNDLCRTSVQRYTKEWRATVERMGRWVDMDWDYRTMDPDYMESIWWVFAKLHEKNLIYEGHKPMHICPRCVTPLSNFEVTQGYKEVTDVTATAMFELEEERNEKRKGGEEKTYFLAWTTTPWTLPGNLFLAINKDVDYVKFRYNDRLFIVAAEIWEKRNDPHNVLHSMMFANVDGTFHEIASRVSDPFKGSELVGKKYRPLFPYFESDYSNAFRVVSGDFVTTEDGTGIVHIAPGFGEDDFQVWQNEKRKTKNELPLLQHVSMDGHFIDAVTDFAGQGVKPIDDPSKTDRKIVEWLEQKGKLFASGKEKHSYPHCWRCDSPLLNYATSSWFVAVERIRERMLEANAKTAWVPAHIRDKRFGNWLENARDWAVSRNRYWGTPLPIWRCAETGEIDVIGSRDDLMARQQIRFTKVTAVRHGEAESNVGAYYQGEIPGVALTERGKEQAKEAGAFLATQRIDVIYCSPLQRTQQTAQAIAQATGAQIITDDRLREVGMGPFEGKSFDDHDLALVKLRRQKKLKDTAPESIFHLPGMESWEEVRARMADFLAEMLPRHRGQHVVIVSHATPLVTLRHFFTREDPYKLSHRPFPDYATPTGYFWDHALQAQMDLHKNVMDGITWPGPQTDRSVEAVFVRHGETDLNIKKLVQGGDSDPSLNDAGIAQAKALAATLKKQKFDAVISSDLKRAKETADILCKALSLPYGGAYSDLNERNVGVWSERPAADVLAEYPTVLQGTGVVFHHHTPKNGESLSHFLDRLSRAYEMILHEYAGKRILIVTHGGSIRGMRAMADNLSFQDAAATFVPNGESIALSLHPLMKRIPDVLDCWFESGSMPYAEKHFPFEQGHTTLAPLVADRPDAGRGAAGASSSDAHLPHRTEALPPGFPADFIAEGIDQTRGWFYTLTVLSTALFDAPAFRNCIVNGIVLAEDGRKMSKRLQNYPEPTELVERHGADALRFALMRSPAVRGEDLRFSEKIVEETVRSVLLPLWNSYVFFVTYANLAGFEPLARPQTSNHPLDRWIRSEVQDLVNRMTEQLDRYDLSATCNELFDTIDALTNWYIRLSRRRFAGKGVAGESNPEAEASFFDADRDAALTTLYDVLVTLSQVLAPVCPFVTEAIYLNLVPDAHGSIHLTDWPEARPLTEEEQALLRKNRVLRSVVSLGLQIRSEHALKVRQPLQRATIALPAPVRAVCALTDADRALLRQELNVKEIDLADDPGSLGTKVALVDARKAGPRLGTQVQDVIRAGKEGDFEEAADGTVRILDAILGPEEVAIVYRGTEGQNVAADGGIVVSLDTTVTDALRREGHARDLIRAIQRLRKEAGLTVSDPIRLQIEGADALLAAHGDAIAQETHAVLEENDGEAHAIALEDLTATVRFTPLPHGR